MSGAEWPAFRKELLKPYVLFVICLVVKVIEKK